MSIDTVATEAALAWDALSPSPAQRDRLRDVIVRVVGLGERRLRAIEGAMRQRVLAGADLDQVLTDFEATVDRHFGYDRVRRQAAWKRVKSVLWLLFGLAALAALVVLQGWLGQLDTTLAAIVIGTPVLVAAGIAAWIYGWACLRPGYLESDLAHIAT